MFKTLSSIFIIVFIVLSEENTGMNSLAQMPVISEKSGKISLETKNMLTTSSKRAVAGSVMFFTATAIDFGVILPISTKITKDLRAIEEPSLNDLNPTFTLLFASIPVSGVKIAGPIIACASANRSHQAYKRVDSSIPGHKVWQPYKFGWLFRALGASFGIVYGLSPEIETLSYLSTGFQAVADGFWVAACVKSMKYTKENERTAENNSISLTPLLLKKGGGLSLNMNF